MRVVGVVVGVWCVSSAALGVVWASVGAGSRRAAARTRAEVEAARDRDVDVDPEDRPRRYALAPDVARVYARNAASTLDAEWARVCAAMQDET